MRTRRTQLGDNLVYVRDLIQERDELQGEYDSLKETIEELNAELRDLPEGAEEGIEEALENLHGAEKALEEWEEQNLDDLNDLNDAVQVCEDYGGETLILDEHFIEYAQGYAEDIGAIEDNMRWPCNCIDWEAAAEELQSDFTVVEVGGYTYYMK